MIMVFKMQYLHSKRGSLSRTRQEGVLHAANDITNYAPSLMDLPDVHSRNLIRRVCQMVEQQAARIQELEQDFMEVICELT